MMKFLRLLIIGALWLAVGGVAPADDDAGRDENDAAPWVHTFEPKRILFVSPAGAGTGDSEETPMSLARAVETAEPGDLYWLLPGTYRMGQIRLTRSGDRENPIVYRGVPGERVQIIGWIDMLGAYNWVWGIELTNPGATGHIAARAPGSHIINNIIHDNGDASVGIGGWQTGPDHVYYGNIVFQVGHHPEPRARAYPIYTQNRFETDGYKYIVQNMFLDNIPDTGGPGYNFHAYTMGGHVSGFYVRQNFSSRGTFLIGGGNLPSDNIVLEENYFYESTVQLGYRRPIQAEFRDNYLGRSPLQARQFWGRSDGVIPKPGLNIYTGNTLVNMDTPFEAMLLITSAYMGEEMVPRSIVSPIDPADVFDHNTYMGGFRVYLKADGNNRGGAGLDFEGWKRESAADGGNAFDANSQVVAAPDAPFAAVLANEYEEGRGHVAVFNWSKADEVEVDLSPIVRDGAAFRVAPAKDPFGQAAVEGIYDGAVRIPMNNDEFAAFLVISDN